jgi:ABC-type antimicrobial peptide transport system permease subunit
MIGITTAVIGLAVLNAVRSSRPANPATELAGGTATSSRRRVRENASIAIIQIALAVALTTAATLLYRNGTVQNDRLAFATDGMLTADLRLTTPLAPAESAAAYAALLDRTAHTPGIEAGAISSPGTWLGIGTRDRILYECGACAMGGMMLPLQMRMVSHHAVSPGFFSNLGMRVLRGREFDDNDRLGNDRVAIVNETFASTAFEKGEPIGRKLQLGGMRGEWFTVVGIVPDITGSGIGAARASMPALFVPLLQMPPIEATFIVRTAVDIESREQLEALLPVRTDDFAITAVMAMTERLSRAIAPVRWTGILLGVLAVAALLLSLHGVHTSLDAQVRNRRRELAVRAAFGASPRRLAAHIVGRTFRLLTVGITLGLATAFIAARTLESRIGGIPVLDTAPLIAAAFALAALAGAIAAVRRAARTAPARALAEF